MVASLMTNPIDDKHRPANRRSVSRGLTVVPGSQEVPKVSETLFTTFYNIFGTNLVNRALIAFYLQNTMKVNGDLNETLTLAKILEGDDRSPANQTMEMRQPLTPQKPVNLLPEVPSQSSRKLSDREQRDCDVIGKSIFA